MYKTDYSLRWEIENFSFSPEDNGEVLQSPNFSFKNLSDCEFCLRIFPTGDSDKAANFISCFLTCIKSCKSGRIFDIEVEIIGPSGKQLKCVERCNQSIIDGVRWGSSSFLPKTDVLEDTRCTSRDILIVRCKLHGTNNTANVRDESIIRTEIGVDRQMFEWCCWHEYGSISFKNTSISENNFFIFNFTDNGCRISRRHSSSIRACFVSFSIILIDREYDETYSKKFKIFFRRDVDSFEFSLDCFINEVNSNLHIYRHGQEKLFKFRGYFAFTSTREPRHSIQNNIPSETSTIYSSLQEDLRSLFLDKKLTDLKLRVGDEVIEAHKSVLVARSPVFSSMFSHSMSETQSGIVDIVDIDFDILKLFLHYLYTDVVEEMNYEIATNLLMIADKYQVQSLKEKCAMFLKNEISVQRACDILSLADVMNHADLKSVSNDFIIANSATILSSPEWATWMESNMKLASIILSRLTLKVLPPK